MPSDRIRVELQEQLPGRRAPRAALVAARPALSRGADAQLRRRQFGRHFLAQLAEGPEEIRRGETRARMSARAVRSAMRSWNENSYCRRRPRFGAT